MTRPTRFSWPYPQGVGIPGGDPSLPPGQEPVDCCDDAAEMPDRALDTTVFVGVPVSALFAAILADGPDWYYQLDEPSGSFMDSSGNGIVATETGTITRSVAGPIPGEDGVTVDTGESLSLGYTSGPDSAQTIEGWYRWSGTSAVVIEQNRNSVGLCLQLAIGTTSFGAGAGQITAFFNATSYWLGIHTTGSFNDGNWHHVVATWAGGGNITTGQLTIYVDGASVATTADSGNTGGPNAAPISGQGDMSLFNSTPTGAGGAHGTVDADEMAFYPVALSGAQVAAHFSASGGATDWRGAGPEITDGDDSTCIEVIGSDVLRVWLGEAFAIASVRLVIECETAGAKTYVLKGANASDFSDAVTVATLNFTATGSFTADTVTDAWTPTDSYEFWELTGDDETRNICSFELYEQSLVVDVSGLQADIDAAQDDIDDHIADPVDAHDASAVSLLDTSGWYAATDAEAALAEIAAKVVGYSAHGTMGATETFSALTGWHSGTFDANCTFTLSGATSGVAAQMILELAQNGTGGWTVTLPSSVSNKAQLEADQDTTLSTTSFLVLMTRDGGTTWYGFWAGGSGSSISPATTVESETTFGITPAVGTDTEYARQDHTHGSPANPVTEAAVQAVGHYEVMMDGGSPPAALESGSGTDWLYVWVYP